MCITKSWISSAKQWARTIKRYVIALWIAAGDSRTPLTAKIIAAAVAAYALSPIDLIPDFIPVLGYLDDLLIVPLGIMLAVRLVPARLMSEFRILAAARKDRISSRAGLFVVAAIWIGSALAAIWLIAKRFGPVS